MKNETAKQRSVSANDFINRTVNCCWNLSKLFVSCMKMKNTRKKKVFNNACQKNVYTQLWCCWCLKEAAVAGIERPPCLRFFRSAPADRKIDWGRERGREKFCVQAHRTIHAIAISFWNSFDVFRFMFCHFQVLLLRKKKVYHDMSYAVRCSLSSLTEIRSY